MRVAEQGPALPCFKCWRQPNVDRDGAYVYVSCGDCYEEGSSMGTAYSGRVIDAVEAWDEQMEMEYGPWSVCEFCSSLASDWRKDRSGRHMDVCDECARHCDRAAEMDRVLAEQERI